MIRFLITICFAIAGCKGARRTDVPTRPLDPTRLDHERHRALQVPCGKCHPSISARPGADDHKPCDDPACHKKDFLGPPTKLCLTCHTEVVVQPLSAGLKPFPIRDGWQALPPVFSHKQHLDADQMETRVGFHVACVDCHVRDDRSAPTPTADLPSDTAGLARPNHATCARCHASEAAPKGAPRMEDCQRCHQGGPRARQRKRLIRGDLAFDHTRHRTDRRGTVIRCEDCHGGSAGSTGYADHGPPHIQACVGCHDDSNRVPYQMRMRICESCHLDKTSSLTALAPRNHLPATERPLDHTLAFRRDHAEAAERDTVRCATCHTHMSGNPRQACDECHQRMVPLDHRITFRELDHGPEAAADRTRCATCHVVEFCTACHQQRPRSHGFPTTFQKEHGRLARTNIRPCVTCHDQTSFCGAPGCHSGAGTQR